MLPSRRLALGLTLALVLPAAAPLAAQRHDDEEGGPRMLVTGSAIVVIQGRQEQIAMSQTELGPLFALQPLVQRLGGQVRSGPLEQGLYLTLHDETAVLGVGSGAMTVGKKLVRLSQPPRLGQDGLHVPLDVLEQTLGKILGYDFIWSGNDQRLFVMPREKRELAVEYNLVHMQGISTLVMRFPEAPRYRVDREGQRLVVQLLGDEVATPVEPSPVDDPLVRGLAFRGDRIVVDLAPEATVEHYEQSRPFRLVFDVFRRSGGAATTPVGGERPSAPGLTTIVIDPGHGGAETGAVGPSGVEEKELTLLLARTLKRRLESRLPVRVELTRGEDADLPLDTRTAIANHHKADLFISIHLNSSVGRNARGAETYFLSLDASDSLAAQAAEIENRSARGDAALSDLELILWDLAQSQFLAESQRFARLVQEELNQALGLRDRGVKQAPFRVLMGAAMPAVLVELGFISNPEEEAKLLRADYQVELVDALVRAVTRYQAMLVGSTATAP